VSNRGFELLWLVAEKVTYVVHTSFNLVTSHNGLSTEANSTRVSKEKILFSKYPKN